MKAICIQFTYGESLPCQLLTSTGHAHATLASHQDGAVATVENHLAVMITAQVTAYDWDLAISQGFNCELDVPLADRQQPFSLFPQRRTAKDFGNELVARAGQSLDFSISLAIAMLPYLGVGNPSPFHKRNR